MQNTRFFRTAVLFEGGLGIAALVAALPVGPDLFGAIRWEVGVLRDGLLATLALVIGYFVLNVLPLKGLKKVDRFVRRLYRENMATLSVFQLAIIAALAGFGEELLFRGLFQLGLCQLVAFFGGDGNDVLPAVCVVLAVSVLFGLAHAVTKTYFLLAFFISLYLGFLLWQTGNLLLPILVHGLYDFLVFMILRRDSRRTLDESQDFC